MVCLKSETSVTAGGEIQRNRIYLQPLTADQNHGRTFTQAVSSFSSGQQQEAENDASQAQSADGHSSIDRYIHALAVCNSLAQLASQGSEAEFLDCISALLRLKKLWANGRTDAKVVCGSGDAEDETVDHTLLADEIRNIDMESIISHDSLTVSQPVLVVCSKRGTSDGTACENRHQQTECYGVVPSLLTVASTRVATEVGMNRRSSRSDSCIVKKMKCNMCRRKFRTLLGLRMHKRLRHMTPTVSKDVARKFQQGCNDAEGNVESTISALAELSGDVLMSAAQKEVFVCCVCGRQFRLRQSLVVHMVTHTGDRPFACRAPGCTKRFGQSSTRNFHERTHSDRRPFLCTQCGRSFKQSSYLKIHMEMMHGAEQTPLVCPACGKEFRTPKALNLHVWNRHTDERNQVCEQCSKQFKTRQQLLRHQKAVHLHERPWQCTVCTKAFSQPNNLKSHMRTHTGEKPYLCSVCGRSFANLGSCRNHLLAHYSTVSVAASSNCSL